MAIHEEKARSRWYPTDFALFPNIPAQAESLQQKLEQAAEDIGLYVNANKTENMYLKKKSHLHPNCRPLKLADNFTCLGSSVSFTESNVNIRLSKMWTAIDRLSIIWKSDLSDRIKWDIFQATVVSILFYGCTIWTLNKMHREKVGWELHKNATSYIEQILKAALIKTTAVRPPTAHH